jgi:hypothetical protein
MASEPHRLYPPTRFTQMCELYWPKYYNDCSGFVKAVAEKNGVFLSGNANDIVQYTSNSWTCLANGIEAANAASKGKFVIAGLAATTGHGHVVIVVPGQPANGRYPYAYWGTLHEMTFDLGGRKFTINGGVGRRHQTINWAWQQDVLPHVIYRAAEPSKLLRGF